MINPNILLVLQFLKYPKSVSLEDLEQNEKEARDAYYGCLTSYHATTDDAVFALNSACLAAYSAYRANRVYAARAVGKYFKHSKENRQDYLDKLRTPN